MRIVAFADTHQFHDELKVPDGDVVICAGDVCRGGERAELEIFLAWFHRLPHRHRLFVAGNHDRCLEHERADVVAAWPGVTFLEDSGVVIDGVAFWGSPWTPEFLDWSFMLPRGAALAAKWALIPPGTAVLITHGPPQRILDDVAAYRNLPVHDDGEHDDDRYVGCADLRLRVRQVKPRVHLFGHIHSQSGIVDDDGVRFMNVTSNECDLPPTVFELDER